MQVLHRFFHPYAPGAWKPLSESLELTDHKMCSWGDGGLIFEGFYDTATGLHKMVLRYSKEHPKEKKTGLKISMSALGFRYPSKSLLSLTTGAERSVNTIQLQLFSQVDRQESPPSNMHTHTLPQSTTTSFPLLLLLHNILDYSLSLSSLTLESRLFRVSH